VTVVFTISKVPQLYLQECLLAGSSEGKKTRARQEMKLPIFCSVIITNEELLCLVAKFENCNSRIVCDCIYNIYVVYAGCNYLVSVHTVSNCLVITLLTSACSMLLAEECLTLNTQVCMRLLSCVSLKTYVYPCKGIMLMAVLEERKRKN
jgi:hypothetical protein